MKAIKVPSHEELIRLSFSYKNPAESNACSVHTDQNRKILFSFKNDDKEKILSSVDTILGFKTENN